MLDAEQKLSGFGHEDAGSSERSFLKLAMVGEKLRLRIPSRVDWVELAVMYLANKAESIGACDHERHGKLVTAMTEAITNAIVHGNLEISSELKEDPSGAFARVLAERSSDPAYCERLVDIEMDYDGTKCTWTITDQGPGFDVDAVLKKLDEPPNEDDPMACLASGRGIMLMRAFLDDVAWDEQGKRVRLTVFRDAGERRREPRVAALEPVRAAPVEADGTIDWKKAFDAVATDLSRGGVGILTSGLGTATRLMLEMQVDGKPVYVPAEVCNLTRVNDPAGDEPVVQIGCRFLAPGTEAGGGGGVKASLDALQQHHALERMLNRLHGPRETRDDRRDHTRMAYTKPILLQTADGERGAVARDLSKSGVAFVAEFELPKGEPVTVVLPAHVSGGAGGEGDEPIRLWGQVARCQKLAGRFHDIGVKFLD